LNDPCNPRIVAIGGGTGLASVLRGLKPLNCEITAIVTVADDGGSSGRLRKDMGILPPGDIRNCLLALAQAEPDMASLFNHRFRKGELNGHNFGNLFLAAMTEMTGDFQLAVRTMSRILAVRGTVLPATLCDVSLRAEMEDGTEVSGEYNIPQARKKIRRLRMVPKDPPALDEAVKRIEEADGIVIGPGSLYTSVIPNLLVPGIRTAIAGSTAPRMYVCNIMTQPGETDGLSALDHVLALEAHCGRLFSHVLVNTATAPGDIGAKYSLEGRFQVSVDAFALRGRGYVPVTGDYLTKGDLARHDCASLGRSILEFVAGKAGAA
jgi:uncharacterized cofD-like protein